MGVKARIGAAVGLAALVAAGVATGALQQDVDDQIATVHPGDSYTTTLADLDVHSLAETDEAVTMQVTITVTADHPIEIRDVLAFEVEGEPQRLFRTEADEVTVDTLNPRVPVALTVSYRPDEDETEIRPVIVDGIWQTQDENALQLPDHLVRPRIVAVVQP